MNVGDRVEFVSRVGPGLEFQGAAKGKRGTIVRREDSGLPPVRWVDGGTYDTGVLWVLWDDTADPMPTIAVNLKLVPAIDLLGELVGSTGEEDE